MQNHKITRIIIFALLLASVKTSAQNSITLNGNASLGMVSPNVFGQFIEYMGHCINGGVIDEGSPLSDAKGIRRDVLEKAKELAPTMLRFPGGTSVKVFHWEDGVGPLAERRSHKNLVWGGIDNYHFGTCEFIQYCRELGCEPVLVVNISTGTPDEAANWVEYCNGTGDTYYANLRRKHGFEQPFHVKYWALGNEEAAEPDAGRHQDPKFYVKDVWQYIKLMKLTDPTIELIADGERGKPEWNKTILEGLNGAIDYISYHGYVSTAAGHPFSIYEDVDKVDKELTDFAANIRRYAPGDRPSSWNKWYRFPARTKPIRIAMDEWGIWERQGAVYGTTDIYEWRHGLATARYLNVILRHAADLGMCNWAQMVNVLAPIMTNETTSIRQTVFFPLKEYRHAALGESLPADVVSEKADNNLNALDVAATIDRAGHKVVVFVVNIAPKAVKASLSATRLGTLTLTKSTILTGDRLDATNVLEHPDRNVVSTKVKTENRHVKDFSFPANSVTVLNLTY